MINVNGLDFHVVDEGTGPAVLLLHGWPDSSELWRHQVPALVGAGFRVVAPDLRGFGQSAKPEGVDQYNLGLLLTDAVGILDALGIERARVVGHDWGAALAWTLAAFMPDRVEKLVAVSVGHPGAFGAAGVEQRRRSWYMLLFQFPVAEEVLSRNDFAALREWFDMGVDFDRYKRDMSRPGALTAGLNWYRANLSPEALFSAEPPPVPPVTMPTMGVWSDGDVALTEAQMEGSGAFVNPGPWRYERIEKVGHFIPVEAPDRMTELLLEFLP
jgi:pimeloyl-ACP methyl ester carboxylesterase